MPQYEFILCESPHPSAPFDPLVKIGVLTNIKQRQFSLVRNRAGTCQFNLRTTDPMAYKILDQVDLGDVRGTVRKCVRIRRNKVDLWSGPIWGISGDLPDGWMQISCVGWLETLQHRILWSTADYSNQGYGVPGDRIAFGLLRAVDAQDPNHRLLIQPGVVVGDMEVRNRYYVLGQLLGPAIQELSDIEAGFDYEVDPVTRAMNLYAWNSFATRPNIHLGYQWGPNNIQKLQWQESADKTCNSMVVISQGAPVGPIVDLPAQDQYNLFEEFNTLTGANQSVLAPYAEAELAIRSRPLVTYNVTPFPNAQRSGGPSLFDDYQIGDSIMFSAHQGAFSVKRQAIRVFGASVDLDDADNETVSNLMLAPQT